MKTLGIRIEDELHAQLSVLAQLAETTITDEIRQALEEHVETKRTSPELTARAQAVRDEIEREAQTRQAAIATLFGPTDQPSTDGPAAGNKRAARGGETVANG